MKDSLSEQNALGTIKYNEEVIKAMVGMALSQVEGVAGIDGRNAGNILGRKHHSHINKIAVEGKKVVIELSITVNYGLPLQDVARKVQHRVRDTIQSMTDLNVGAVHVTVAGVVVQE